MFLYWWINREKKGGGGEEKKGLGVSGISRMFSLCEDKAAAVLLSSPARSQQEAWLAIPPPSCSPVSSSFLPVPPIWLLSALNIWRRTLTESFMKSKKRDNIFSWSGNRPCDFWGVSFPFESLPGKRIRVCQAVSWQAGALCAEKDRGSSCSVCCAKFHPCQNSTQHNSLHPWGEK